MAGIHHVRGGMRQGEAIEDAEEVHRWVLVEDNVIFRQVAMGIGRENLQALAGEWIRNECFLKAAKARYGEMFCEGNMGMSMLIDNAKAHEGQALLEGAISLIERSGIVNPQAAQLKYNILSVLQRQVPSGDPKRNQLGAQMRDLISCNPTLRFDPWAAFMGTYYQPHRDATGNAMTFWNEGRDITDETIADATESVTATQSYKGASVGCSSFSVGQMTFGGAGCSNIMRSINLHNFERHVVSATSTAVFYNCFLMNFSVMLSVIVRISVALMRCYKMPQVTRIAEKCGDVSHLIKAFEKQAETSRVTNRSQAESLAMMLSLAFFQHAGDFVDSELQHLHPWHDEIWRTLEAADFLPDPGDDVLSKWDRIRLFQLINGPQVSADGLHHRFPLQGQQTFLRAVVELARPADAAVALDTSWIDALPSPESGTVLLDTFQHCVGQTGTRVILALLCCEKLGRFADALVFAQAEVQDPFAFNIPSRSSADAGLDEPAAAPDANLDVWSRIDAYAKRMGQRGTDLFRLMDEDKSGSVTREEFAAALDRLGVHVTAQEVATVVSKVDIDGDGSISVAEFKEAVRVHKRSKTPRRRRVLEPEEPLLWTASEVSSFLRSFGGSRQFQGPSAAVQSSCTVQAGNEERATPAIVVSKADLQKIQTYASTAWESQQRRVFLKNTIFATPLPSSIFAEEDVEAQRAAISKCFDSFGVVAHVEPVPPIGPADTGAVFIEFEDEAAVIAAHEADSGAISVGGEPVEQLVMLASCEWASMGGCLAVDNHDVTRLPALAAEISGEALG
eukprot:g2267.t1